MQIHAGLWCADCSTWYLVAKVSACGHAGMHQYMWCMPSVCMQASSIIRACTVEFYVPMLAAKVNISALESLAACNLTGRLSRLCSKELHATSFVMHGMALHLAFQLAIHLAACLPPSALLQHANSTSRPSAGIFPWWPAITA